MLISVSVKCRSMFVLLVLLNLLLCHADDLSDDDFGTNLVASMKDDANLDLSADEEYEDLRAELLAYHTALASISSNSKRRSMISTPCWNLGGICVDYKLCTGFRYLTEVPGCKNKLMVCCFAWNKYEVKDWKHKGLTNLAMPWSQPLEFGGLGVIVKDDKNLKKKNKKKKNKNYKLSQIVNNEEGISGENDDNEKNYDNLEIRHAKQDENNDKVELENVKPKSEINDGFETEIKKNYDVDEDNEKTENTDHNVERNRLRNSLSKKKPLALILRSNK